MPLAFISVCASGWEGGNGNRTGLRQLKMSARQPLPLTFPPPAGYLSYPVPWSLLLPHQKDILEDLVWGQDVHSIMKGRDPHTISTPRFSL